MCMSSTSFVCVYLRTKEPIRFYKMKTCFSNIDLLARPFSYSTKRLKSYSYTFLYAEFDRVVEELLSLLCTFENSTKFSEISFDSDYFQNILGAETFAGRRFREKRKSRN